MRPSEAPGACKHTDYHLCSLHEPSRTWHYECAECGNAWVMPVTVEDAPLVTGLRGGKPLLHAVK